MKTLIAALLLVLASSAAQADVNLDKVSYCSTYASMLKSIAAWRDQGMSPEKTLDLMRSVKGVSPQQKKDAINTVYFDKSYVDARGVELGNQARLDCLAEKSK